MGTGEERKLWKAITFLCVVVLSWSVEVIQLCFTFLSICNVVIRFYYLGESVLAMRLVNFRSVTCYTDQNF